MRDLTRRDKIAVIGLLIFALTVLNYSAHEWIGHTHFAQFDVVFQRLYFLPVILGSFWFALKGGLLVCSIATVSLVPYLIIHWEGLSASDLNRLLLITAYFLMAAVLGKAVLMQRRENQRARESETLAAIGKSMSAIAHEMRTPIIAIGGFAKMVRKNIIDGSPDAEKLDIVVIEALRLENLLKGVLDFARPLVVKRESAKIDRMIQECMAITGHIAEPARIGLEARLQSDLPPVTLDEMRMKQVLINLITNAIQASPQGEKVTVGCSLSRGRTLFVEIIDCGCGIPEHKREKRSFRLFFNKKEGVGLGLPIVKKSSGARGDLRIEDNPRGGVIFRIEIRIAWEYSSDQKCAAVVRCETRRRMRETHKRRVIVSETDKIAAVEKYLKKEFDSATIESGHDAGRKARVFKIKSANHSSTAIVENEFLEKTQRRSHSRPPAHLPPGRTPQGVQLSHVVTTGGLTD